ncbi:MAG: S41 family peptidase [Armatimonadota bacterium]|nr:S41 family peptidase [Armatimonadota bacterium]
MRIRKKLAATVLIGFLLLGAFWAGYGYGQRRASAAETQTQGMALLRELLSAVQQYYIERKIDLDRLMYGAAKGMLEALGDPYTRFMEPRAYRIFQEDARGVFNGIGIFIDIRDGHLIVVQPIEGTPAHRKGLRPGDKILSIDGVSTKDMALQEAVMRIRGPAGTTVRLKLEREGRVFEVEIVRAKIQIDTVQGPEIVDAAVRKELEQERLGYVRILTFNEATSRDFEETLRPMVQRGIRGLILDLRNNGGGLLDSVIKVADDFLEGGPVVYVVDRNGKKEASMAKGGAIFKGPVVVLVNEFTASAAEILAGALQDRLDAPLVGVQTFGKGVIQTIVPLPGGAAASITTARYLTPKGRDIHKKGLSPTVVAGERIEGKPDLEVRKIQAQQLSKAIEVLKNMLVRRK